MNAGARDWTDDCVRIRSARRIAKRMGSASIVAGALVLAGCWTAPLATVQPQGAPRLIQGAIRVVAVKPYATVKSVDLSSGTIVLLPEGKAAVTYRVGRAVSNLERIKAGDSVRAAISEELTIYVLRDGQLPGPDGAPQTIAADARVLSVDPSYRLLTRQYTNGVTETFKVGLRVRLSEMACGDAVLTRPTEVVALKLQR